MVSPSDTQAWQLVPEKTDIWPVPQRAQYSSWEKVRLMVFVILNDPSACSHGSVLFLVPCVELFIILDTINIDWLLIRFAFGFQEPSRIIQHTMFWPLAICVFSGPGIPPLSLLCFRKLPSILLVLSSEVKLTEGPSWGCMILLFSLYSMF